MQANLDLVLDSENALIYLHEEEEILVSYSDTGSSLLVKH